MAESSLWAELGSDSLALGAVGGGGGGRGVRGVGRAAGVVEAGHPPDPPEGGNMLAKVEVSLPDQTVATHALPGDVGGSGVEAGVAVSVVGGRGPSLRCEHENTQVPLRIGGDKAEVTVVYGELACVYLGKQEP